MAMDISSGDTGASPDEVTPLAELTAAIKQVRTDGINKPGLRVPEPLSRALGIDSNPQAAVSQVRQAILSCAVQLERTRRLAFLFGAGFREDIWGSSGQRVARTAKALGLSRRNTYLQIHRASEAMAAQLLRIGSAATLTETEYVTNWTGCYVDFHQHNPEIRLTRTIMALRDGIENLNEEIFLPALKDREIRHLGLEGCQVTSTEAKAGSWELQLTFPEPLHVGENHTYSILLEAPDKKAIAPMLVLSPQNPHQDSQIELHFGKERPNLIERFDRVWTSQATDPDFQGVPVTIDADPVVVEFKNMEQGWDYGVRWSW